MRDPFRSLGERLRRDGISPGRAARYTAELEEHLADLIAEGARTGLSPDAARAAALQRLGDEDNLVAAMLSQPGLRSRTSRLPVLVWLALPLAAELGLIALLAVLLVAAGRQGLAPTAPALVDALLLLAPLGIAWTVATHALRRRAQIGWPLLGMAVTLLAASGLDLTIAPRALAVSLSSPALDRLTFYTLAAIAPFLLLHRHLRVR